MLKVDVRPTPLKANRKDNVRQMLYNNVKHNDDGM